MKNNLFNWFIKKEVSTVDKPALSPLEKLFIKKISPYFASGTSVFNNQEIGIGDEVRTFNFLITGANGSTIGVEFVVGEYDNKRKIAPGDEKLAVSCQIDSMYRFTGPEIMPFLNDCVFFILKFDGDMFIPGWASKNSSAFSESMLQPFSYTMIAEDSSFSYRQIIMVERRTKNPPWPLNESSYGSANEQGDHEDCITSENQKHAAEPAEPAEPEKSGDFSTVLEEFMEKSRIKPRWRYPLYDTLFLSVYGDESDKILSSFKREDREDPNGFFPKKEVLYALEGEKEGRFPRGLYLYYKQIQLNRELTEPQKLEIATGITQNVPGFSPGWLALASLLPEKENQLAAIEQGLSANSDQHTKGLMLLHKAFALSASGRNNESVKILGELIRSPELTSNFH